MAVRALGGRFGALGSRQGIPGWLLTTAGQVPNVDMDFANGRYWGVLVGGLTVSRASSGTVWDSNNNYSVVGANLPRIGAGNGLLVEEARTNSIRVNDTTGAVAADGVERTTNGNFALNPLNASPSTVQNGWQWRIDGGTATVTWNGSSSVTVAGDATNSGRLGSMGLTTVIGVTYTITADITGHAANVQAGTSSFGTTLLNVASSTGAGQKFQFTATATTTFVSFANSSVTGAVIANVSVQSAGALPTNWIVAALPTGLTRTITLGTVNGVSYIGINYSGTTTSASAIQIFFEVSSQISATYGQTWSDSLFFQVTADDPSINAIVTGISEQNSGGSQVAFGQSASFYTSRLTWARQALQYTLTNSATNFIRSYVTTNSISNGSTVNYTFRIGWPQLELNPFINSTVASASVAAGGTAGTAGTQTVTVSGGTGTAATLNVTVSGGAITAINSVTTAGSYSVFPPSPAAVTGAGLTGATVNLTPTNNASQGFATSPIVTSGSAVARAADAVSFSPPNPGAGISVMFSGASQAPNANTINRYMFSWSDGTTTNRFVAFVNGASSSQIQFRNSAGASINSAVSAGTSLNKVAESSVTSAAINGSTVSTVAGGVPPVTQFRVGANETGTTNQDWNGFVSRTALWANVALNSTSLQSITT